MDALRLLVLDFDGVILESNDAKTEAFREVFGRFPEHRDAMMAYHHEHISLSRFAKFDHLIQVRLGRAANDPLRAELATEFSRHVVARLAAVPFVPGAQAFLEEYSACLPLYLASVTPEAELEETLVRRGVRHCFRGVYGCPPWTKPDAVRAALRREACPAAAAALVGDSPGDQRAASETGVEFIARDSGIPFVPPVPRAHPDLHAIADVVRVRLS
jgi:phosphoglycolate phosphatase-like HAD superfamily hydrolase